MTLKTLGASALLSACAITAHAGTLTFETGFSSTSLEVSDQSVSLSAFDTSRGALSAAELVLTASLLIDAGIENTGDLAATGDLVISANLFAQERSSGLAFVELAPTQTIAVDLEGFDGTLDYAGTSGQSVSDVLIKETARQTILDPATLASLGGSGALTFDFESFGQIDAFGTSRFATGLQAMGAGSLSVSLAINYTYDAPAAPSQVALPASLPLFFVALVGLIGLAWRKR